MSSRVIFAASFALTAALVATASYGAPAIVAARAPAIANAAPLVLNAEGRIVSVDRVNTQSGAFTLSPIASGVTTSAFRFDAANVSVEGHWANTVPSISNFSPYQPVTSRSLRDVRLTAHLAPGFDLDLAQGRDLATAVNPFDLRSGDGRGLFLSASALNSPFIAAIDGGTYGGVTMSFGDDLRLRAGAGFLSSGTVVDPYTSGIAALPRDFALLTGDGARSGSLTAGSLELRLNEWAGLALSASRTRENGSLFGAAGVMNTASALDTNALGISARVGFGGGWVTTMSYNDATSHLNLRNDTALKNQTYGLAVAKEGVFGDDALGIAVSRPLQVYGGDSNFSSTIDTQGRLVFANARSQVAPSAPESDIELGYVTTFLDGSLALQANAAYQVNAGGERGSDALSVVSRAKINF